MSLYLYVVEPISNPVKVLVLVMFGLIASVAKVPPLVCSITDAAVAVEVSVAGLRGACLNVLININEISDGSFSSKKSKEVKDLIEKSEELRVVSFNNTLKIISGFK